MVYFLLEFLVNVIITAAVLPVAGYVFGFSPSFTAPFLQAAGLPGGELWETVFLAAGIVLGMAAAAVLCLFLVPGFEAGMARAHGGRTPDAEERAYLEMLLADLKRRIPDLPALRLYVAHQPVMNAFSVGRRTVVVFRPLLAVLDREEAEGVLAHEIGHLMHRDTVWGLLSYGVSRTGETAMGFLVFLIRVLALLAWIPMLGFLFLFWILCLRILLFLLSFLVRMPANVLALFGSRQNEYDADRFAVEAGLGEGLYRALAVLRSYEKPRGRAERLSSDHPDTEKRMRRIRKMLWQRGEIF